MQSTREMLHITTFVRQRETKNIHIPNRTNMLWNLRPSIEGEFFSGADHFVVEPQTTKPYEVAYHPVVMTMEGKRHTVSKAGMFVFSEFVSNKFAGNCLVLLLSQVVNLC